MKKFFALITTLGILVSGQALANELPEYKRVSGVSGKVSSVGSDTLANLMTLWAEEFTRLYPNVDMQIQAAGSSTAPPALTEGSSNLGPMSRKMKNREIQAFEKHFGYKPTAIPVAIDALAVYVHKDNPIKDMTMQQLDAVFSSTRKCGYNRDIKYWGDLGLDARWQRRTIQLYGRNSVSGTYGYFKKVALCRGDYKDSVNEQPGSSSVVQSTSSSIRAIGFSGIGYRTASVKLVPLAKNANSKFIEPNVKTSSNGTYPLSRLLYVYVNKQPNKPLPPLEREFVKLILSKVGQAVVEKDGYVPLPASVAEKTLKSLGLNPIAD